jgi:hypothetical protein
MHQPIRSYSFALDRPLIARPSAGQPKIDADTIARRLPWSWDDER